MSWHPEAYLEQLYRNTEQRYRFSARNEEEWKRWHEELRNVLIEDLGGFPKTRTDLNPVTLEEHDAGDYIRKRVVLQTEPQLEMPVYVLIPKNVKPPYPAVVACHGHGYGSKAIVGLRFDGSERTEPEYQKNFALELVKRGYLVAAPELLGFGDRRLKEMADADPEENSCYRISVQLLLMGKTIAGLRVYETLRTIDYLQSRADVDEARIGLMGISGGGLIGSFAAAIDDRIKVAVISGYVNTFKGSIMPIRHCVDNYIPGLLQHAEMPDLISLIAPRPLLIESGTKDHIFPIPHADEAYARIQQVYKLLNQEERLDRDVFEGGHQISGNKAYDWFKKWL